MPNPATSHHRAPAWHWVLATALILAAASIPVLRFLIFWPKDQWQVDVEVYREAGVSILIGRPIYDAMTEAPQLLPFTYPPFAAILAIPLALLPFGVVGWLWTVAQIAATTGIVWYAAYRLIHTGPGGAARPLILGALAAPMFWLHPVGDGIRFGQVNAFIVLACLMDLRRPRPRLLRSIAPGVLVGLAMAIKLTPGVFLIHYLVTKRYREAAAAVATAAGTWIAAAILLPSASLAFWGGALQDPARLGPNMGTSNQSIRGVLMRLGPDGVAGSAIWLVCVLAVGAFGFALARRAYLAGDSITEVAAVGLMACLLSPVAWIHHFHWMVVVVLAILGAQPWRDRRRAFAAALIWVWFTCRLPWWGISWIANDWPPEVIGRILQNADLAGALLALWLMHWALRRSAPGRPGALSPGPTPPASGARGAGIRSRRPAGSSPGASA
ncbi:MAG: glycosyltransferase 87 family protein [Actinobacteria bacterium]|uniref:Glycosyltransferase 87 family protein n=1 Tax=Nostocoides veronense TaxID=330836 RepID=A0ABP4Y7T5_9MICO|nr:glycosyltransferase 87 family protein [Actinomycetota bacterium]